VPPRRIVEHAAVGRDHVIDDGIARRADLDDPPAEHSSQVSNESIFPTVATMILPCYKAGAGSELSNPVFFDQDPQEIDTDAVSFRSFSKMSARERDAAISAGSLGLQLSSWIEERFSLPASKLLDLSYETDPEIAAHSVRQSWSIGERPIGNLMGLLLKILHL
jgi:hypothetical protein